MVASEVPVDRGWAWMIGFGAFVQNMIMIGVLKSFGILLFEYIDEFNVYSALWSCIIGIQSLTFAFAAPTVLYIFTSIFTNRQVMLFGSVMASLGIGLGFFAQNIAFLRFTYGALIGIGNACLYGPSLVMISKYFEKRRGLVTGVAIAGGSVGQYIMPPIVQLLIDNYGLRGGLLLIGGIMFHGAITSSLMRPTVYYTHAYTEDHSSNKASVCFKKCSVHTNSEQTEPLDNNQHNGINVDKEATHVFNFKKLIDLSLMKNNKYIMLLSAVCFGVAGSIGVVGYISTHATDLGMTFQDSVWLLVIIDGADLIGRIACGALADSGLIQRYNILVISFFLNGVLANLMPLVTMYWHLYVYCVVYGLVGRFYFSLISLVLVDFFGLEKLPKSLGPLFFVEASAKVILPFIFRYLDEKYENYLTSLYYIGGTSILAAFILFSTRFLQIVTDGETESNYNTDNEEKIKCFTETLDCETEGNSVEENAEKTNPDIK